MQALTILLIALTLLAPAVAAETAHDVCPFDQRRTCCDVRVIARHLADACVYVEHGTVWIVLS